LIQFFAPKIDHKYFDYVHREMFSIGIAQQMPRKGNNGVFFVRMAQRKMIDKVIHKISILL